eukprot:1818856-Prymnesium_polylepis.1
MVVEQAVLVVNHVEPAQIDTLDSKAWALAQETEQLHPLLFQDKVEAHVVSDRELHRCAHVVQEILGDIDAIPTHCEDERTAKDLLISRTTPLFTCPGSPGRSISRGSVRAGAALLAARGAARFVRGLQHLGQRPKKHGGHFDVLVDCHKRGASSKLSALLSPPTKLTGPQPRPSVPFPRKIAYGRPVCRHHIAPRCAAPARNWPRTRVRT